MFSLGSKENFTVTGLRTSKNFSGHCSFLIFFQTRKQTQRSQWCLPNLTITQWTGTRIHKLDIFLWLYKLNWQQSSEEKRVIFILLLNQEQILLWPISKTIPEGSIHQLGSPWYQMSATCHRTDIKRCSGKWSSKCSDIQSYASLVQKVTWTKIDFCIPSGKNNNFYFQHIQILSHSYLGTIRKRENLGIKWKGK